MCRRSARAKENDGSYTSGKNRAVSARSANKRSPKSRDGTVIMCSGAQKGEQIEQKTESYSIPPAINKFIAKVYPLRNRVR